MSTTTTGPLHYQSVPMDSIFRKNPTTNGSATTGNANGHANTSGSTRDEGNTSDSSYIDDPIGMKITELLNAGGGAFESMSFSSNTTNSNDDNNDNNNNNKSTTKGEFVPLFSLVNFHRLRRICLQSWRIIANSAKSSSSSSSSSSNTGIGDIQQMKRINLPTKNITMTQTMKIICTILLLSSIFISTCTQFILSTIIMYYIVILLFILSLLVDYQDLYNISPMFIQRSIDLGNHYIEFVGIEYLYTKRFLGRDQWALLKQKRQDVRMDGAYRYQYLIERKVPFAISNEHTNQSKNNSNTKSSSSPTNTAWKCQNINWDKLCSTLKRTQQAINNENNDKMDTDADVDVDADLSTLDQSSLDHLVAMNYCYIMIHGKGKKKSSLAGGGSNTNSAKEKQKSKKKVQIIHRKRGCSSNSNSNSQSQSHSNETKNSNKTSNKNLSINTRLSPIRSSRSEDTAALYSGRNGNDNDNDTNSYSDLFNTTQLSMDAIELVRPKSVQKEDFIKKIQASPLIQLSKQKFFRNNHDNHHRHRHRQDPFDSNMNHTNLNMDNNAIDTDITTNNKLSTKSQMDYNLNNKVLPASRNLTVAASEEFPQEEFTDSFSNEEHNNDIDEDVSFSSTSYIEKQTTQDVDDSYNKKDKGDMKWLDVGAKIGMRILESEKLHQAITKSQMAANLSSSYSGTEEEKDIEQKESFDVNNFESPKNVAKPFHAMWTSPNVDNTSFEDVISEDDCSYSEVGDEVDMDVILAQPPSISRRSSLTSLSPLSSKKVLKRGAVKSMRGFGRSISLPTSPIRSPSVASRLSENTNVSVLSPEPLLLAPKQFSANQYLPPSMAIYHQKVNHEKAKPAVKRNRSSPNMQIADLAIKTNILNEFSKKFHKESIRTKGRRRNVVLLPGVRMIVPIFPTSRTKRDKGANNHHSYYQFATVTSSKRINAATAKTDEEHTDCLSITVLLDKSLLRNAKFAEMTMRIPDSQRHMPRHSKFPIGACVATSFGIGVLVGWRAEDDCHIIRALWQKRGIGVAHAYLNRNALHELMEAAVGFKVTTSFGNGNVIAYVKGGKHFTDGKYVVLVKKTEGRTNRIQMELSRSEIKSCHSSNFIPVVEQIKEAAKYQIQVDKYESLKFQKLLEDESLLLNQTWRIFSEGFELFLSSFIKAAEEDDNIDGEINNFLTSIIEFLEDFDLGQGKKANACLSPVRPRRSTSESTTLNMKGPGMWIVDDLLGDVTGSDEVSSLPTLKGDDKEFGMKSYKKVYAFLNTTARTVAIAESSCTEKPNLKMALAISHEILTFVHNIIKVQQVNMSETSVKAWRKTLVEFRHVFGSVNTRLQAIGNGIIQRLQEHGKVAKVRAIRFADTVISDDLLMKYLEDGDVKKCMQRFEKAVVSANIMDNESCEQYHDIVLALYNTLAPRDERNQEAAARSGKKITFLAKFVKVLATPGRSLLKLLMNDEILEIIERVFVRVFEKEKDACQVINIYSWNFRSLRHLRLLNNIAISGGLWAPVLDAADEEFTWAVSRTPAATRDYVIPVSKLFSLGVARFHQLYKSEENISADWLDFLKEDEAVKIIQDLDAALMLSLENLCKDVKEMMQVLPYYSSIDEDFLQLIDEVDLKKEIKEAGEAIVDADKFPQYVREKSAKAVKSFLDYLPKMSIPIEKREIGEGWVVTCRGRNGKDLTLSNVNTEKENLLCKVLGGDNVLLPVFEECKMEKKSSISSLVESALFSDADGNVEVSILDHVAELIRNAQSHGCWMVGMDGITQSDSPYIAGSSLEGLPLSEVLLCAIDLWENLEIDDDELLEIAIRDVSHQIQLQKKVDEKVEIDFAADKNWPQESLDIRSRHMHFTNRDILPPDVTYCNTRSSSESSQRRFDPKKDPTVLDLVMSQLTCCLDDFTYRVEPAKRISMFDPVFEGIGTLTIKNASIKLRIECRKETIKKRHGEVTVPVLQLQELHVGLEQVNFRFKETGADWLLNKIVSNFSKGITQLVRDNIKEQISLTINDALEHLNSYMEVNPELMLKILGISIDDLEENIAWV